MRRWEEGCLDFIVFFFINKRDEFEFFLCNFVTGK